MRRVPKMFRVFELSAFLFFLDFIAGIMNTIRERVVDERAMHVTSVFQKTGDHAVLDHDADSDEEVLLALGYKQEFKRDFSIWTSFAVSFSVLGLLPSVASTLSYNLAYSGPAGSVWGWFVACIPIQFIALSMAELCSSMPTAGGLYYASAVLAPAGWGPLCSWITGWSNFTGWATAPCAINYALASMVLTAAEIGHPTYVAQTYQVYLMMLALLFIEGLLTMNSTKFLAWMNSVGTVVNVFVVFIFVIWMPVGSINGPKTNPNNIVWTSDGIVNGTEWPTGFAFMMGMLSVIVTIAGFDAPFHLSEECSNANIASPRAILMTAQLGMYMGWAIIIAVAYTVKDITDVVSGQYGQPMGSLCLQVLGPKAGLAMFALNIFAQCIVASSRVTFSFSRDDALPFSRYLKRVNTYTKTPVNAVWFIVLIASLVGLLIFASPVAIGAVFSIAAIAQYVAFGLPICLKLFVVGDKFRPGPWNLGRFSKPIGIIAVAWIVLIIPILCFPAVKGKDLNKLNMNYASLVYGGVMLLAMTWYAVDARKWFKGPKINVEHLIGGRVLVGEGSGSEVREVVVGKK
ncbi:probable UGA4 GABA permease-also involved in delta-aminolevulinate transport [Phialocephala subalpina]|uniref:Probable UGA4 GABA permease-also involved in delta-aminolevulinate transport n=1 Tax=Phialocephala subalpina TaxID=576137 RepID=A0A1L7WUM1_9HELO|nr:probable UGA4 GABA permease-also involved in delta-aminolevulinate transport [Phialocephala subalpina]